MAKKTHRGSCHCGRVKFEAAFDLADGTGKCNCTSCWKKRWWSVRAKPADFKSLAGEDALSGTKSGRPGGFCKHCGVGMYHPVPVAEWNPEEYVSISVASFDDLDPAELAAAPVRYMDGLHDNWWEAPKETRHL